MNHSEYREHICREIAARSHDQEFLNSLLNYRKELDMMLSLNTDPVLPLLRKCYSPTERRRPHDPDCMLRSLVLMTVHRQRSITEWVRETRTVSVLGILSGFSPPDTPGVGTYYDFMKRLTDSPYVRPCAHVEKRSTLTSGKHLRNRQREKDAKKENRDPHQSQSEKLAAELLAHTDDPRPDGFPKILEDIFILIGILPCVRDGLLSPENMTVSGDGSVQASYASADGKPACDCRSHGITDCDHGRYYGSPTAEWCYCHHHGCFIFGDRYYHIVVTQNGHDFVLITIMPGGNESDYTLSLKAFDRLLKMFREHGLSFLISGFIGDGHHDSYAHYEYFAKKGVIPFIPLSEGSKNARPHLSGKPDVILGKDGIPLCPAGIPMRHHLYNKSKRTHVYCCPVKRQTHRDGKAVYVTHEDECPLKKDCQPGSPIGPLVYVKSDDDPRFFPPVPRSSDQFKETVKQRSASERINFVNDSYNTDGTCMNADYGLIRLLLANLAHHMNIRHTEAGGTDFLPVPVTPEAAGSPDPEGCPENSAAESPAECLSPVTETLTGHTAARCDDGTAEPQTGHSAIPQGIFVGRASPLYPENNDGSGEVPGEHPGLSPETFVSNASYLYPENDDGTADFPAEHFASSSETFVIHAPAQFSENDPADSPAENSVTESLSVTVSEHIMFLVVFITAVILGILVTGPPFRLLFSVGIAAGQSSARSQDTGGTLPHRLSFRTPEQPRGP
ncbi:MAG: hypothetical protein GY765_09690 [bacterium]|nr:hypothetical protein [bacterium]